MLFTALKQPHLAPALLISVGLHLLVLAGLLYYSLRNPVPLAQPPTQGMLVELVRRSQPLPAPAAVAQAQQDPELEDEDESSLHEAETNEPQLISAEAEESAAPPAQDDDVAETQLTQEQILQAAIQELLSASDELPAPTASPPLTAAGLQATVSRLVRRQQSSYTRSWVSECWIEKQQRPLDECAGQASADVSANQDERAHVAQLFADINRSATHARLSQTLGRRNEQLQAMMQGEGPQAEIASTLQGINKEYLMYLNGNYNLRTWSWVQAAMHNDGNLDYIGNFMQFICNPSPCVYDWTGFTITLPEQWQEPEENAFVPSPVLFSTGK